MELLDLYDDFGNKTGKVIERGTKFESGNVMLSIIFIKNSNNQYLVQKTSEEKDSIFSSTGGHVTHNENGLNTIVRELEEELGLVIDKDEIKFIDFLKMPNKRCVVNLYLLEKDVELKNLKLQQEEVEYVKWMSGKEILNLINKEQFQASHAYLFQKYFFKD